ncbi:hypothetical protein AVEN_261471-1 [Araneus ventricosus]|uniref:Uncharacterized protein n=1 Tax=Araneus ventricosus TaxID=182803 RepID=A0A4Y2UB16_ARAVE|nr:hypothetical protein AVEN_261471-1 [Araneus ventricosus]
MSALGRRTTGIRPLDVPRGSAYHQTTRTRLSHSGGVPAGDSPQDPIAARTTGGCTSFLDVRIGGRVSRVCTTSAIGGVPPVHSPFRCPITERITGGSHLMVPNKARGHGACTRCHHRGVPLKIYPINN